MVVCALQVVSAGSVVKLSADLKRLLGDTLFADTEVKLSDGESVCAHAAVLAARWPQFREVSVCTHFSICEVYGVVSRHAIG